MKAEDVFGRTVTKCKLAEYKGWDPYDGLNSKIFNNLPIRKSKFFRMAWIQLFKHSPINFRNILQVNKGENPKGLALMLTSFCNFYKLLQAKGSDYEIEGWDLQSVRKEIDYLVVRLKELRAPHYSNYCWGYNFPWQSRAFFLEKWCPTIVATSFVTDSILNAYEVTQEQELLDIAYSSTQFILEDLNKLENGTGVGYSYSPVDNRLVFNATLLGSRLLANVYKYTLDKKLLLHAKSSIESVVPAFNSDGSIDHSVQVGKLWRDNFHTGFKIESMIRYEEVSGDKEYTEVIEKSIEYWLNNFFDESGACHYFDDRKFPLDIHCPGQFFATMYHIKTNYKELNLKRVHRDFIEKVSDWMLNEFYVVKNNHFIFQKKRNYSIKTSYMRWGQCWAIYGLSFYLLIKNEISE